MKEVKNLFVSCGNLVILVLSILATPAQKILDATWGLAEDTAKDIFGMQFNSITFSEIRLNTPTSWVTIEKHLTGSVGYRSVVPSNPFIIGNFYLAIESVIKAYTEQIGFVLTEVHYRRLTEVAPHLITKFLIDNNVQGAAIYDITKSTTLSDVTKMLQGMTPGMLPNGEQILQAAGLIEVNTATSGQPPAPNINTAATSSEVAGKATDARQTELVGTTRS